MTEHVERIFRAKDFGRAKNMSSRHLRKAGVEYGHLRHYEIVRLEGEAKPWSVYVRYVKPDSK